MNVEGYPYHLLSELLSKSKANIKMPYSTYRKSEFKHKILKNSNIGAYQMEFVNSFIGTQGLRNSFSGKLNV